MSWLSQLQHSCHHGSAPCVQHSPWHLTLLFARRFAFSRPAVARPIHQGGTSVPYSSAPAAAELHEQETEDANSGSDLQLPPPSHTRVKTAEYVSSGVKLSDCPKERWPEFAVIGRSNVGKSSLINLLTGRKALALVSKTPG